MKTYTLTDEMIKNIIEVAFGSGKICGIAKMDYEQQQKILSDLVKNQLEIHKYFSNEKPL